jgi:hypothetical protein
VSVELGAARNEFEAFQVIVTGPAKGVSARVEALQGPGRIDDVKLYREELINLAHPSAIDGGTGLWPDALVPDVDDVVGEKRNAFPFDVNAGESRAIFVDVHVPKDAAPGVYSGAVVVSSSDGDAKIPVSLEVWDFELPSTSSLRTAFGLSYPVIQQGHGVSGDDISRVRARYAQLGLDHRISISGITDDGFNNDLSHFDRFYSDVMNGTAATRLPGARLTAVKYVGDRNSVDVHKTWAQHFRANGWMDRLFDYVCDEPPLTCQWSDIPGRAKAAHDADPEFKTLVTTQIWDADAHGATDSIDIMVPLVNFTDYRPPSGNGDQVYKYADFASKPGKEMWMYESCVSHDCGGTVNYNAPTAYDQYYTGWPTYVIDANATRNRAMQWLQFLEGSKGEVYYETALAYAHDAWSNQWDFNGNGDGTLFYPGTPSRIGGQTHIPVASLRLKMIREGMEDFEYLKLLSDLGGKDDATKIARDLFPTAWQTDVDPAKLLAARKELASKILERTGKPTPAAVAGSSSGLSGAHAGGGCGTTGAGLGAVLALPLLLVLRRRK